MFFFPEFLTTFNFACQFHVGVFNGMYSFSYRFKILYVQYALFASNHFLSHLLVTSIHWTFTSNKSFRGCMMSLFVLRHVMSFHSSSEFFMFRMFLF